MSRVIKATDARIGFGKLMNRVVNDDEPVIVERSGEPQVVIMSIRNYEALVAASGKKNDLAILDRVLTVTRRIFANKAIVKDKPEDILRQVREARDVQMDMR
ncbi:MAG: type II toxin-antitoxin system Phd/YefM family antitoxin [Deltaproteobacteria bacterium]|nr:type II toxin-antitoxin system Phd/YefM family antitoxin [Deltaproteobacteria bacterium]